MNKMELACHLVMSCGDCSNGDLRQAQVGVSLPHVHCTFDSRTAECMGLLSINFAELFVVYFYFLIT